MELKEVLIALCSAHGVSGSEDSAFAAAKRYLEPVSESISTDANGNLYAIAGNPQAKKTILLDAHLDRIGLIVTDINDKGFVKVDKCGGIDIRTLQNTVFETADGVKGTVCCLPPHLSDGSEDKASPISKTWLDFGMTAGEVKRHIKIGDVLTFSVKPAELLGGKITAPALDNRCGVAALIRTAELLYGKECNLERQKQYLQKILSNNTCISTPELEQAASVLQGMLNFQSTDGRSAEEVCRDQMR